MRPTALRTLAQSVSTLSQRRLVRVKLLKDLEGLGRAGDHCLVQPGRMRNALLPRKQAIYQPLPTFFTRNDASVMAQEAQEALEAAQAAQARQIISKELGAIQLLSLRRNLESVPTITYQRLVTTSTTESLPDPPVMIQGSIGITEIINYIRDTYSIFDIDTDSASPKNRLNPQQISSVCEFTLSPSESLQAGKIKKTGEYALKAKIVPSGITISIPIIVKAASSISSVPPSGLRSYSTARQTITQSMRSKLSDEFSPAEINIRNDSSKHAHHAAMVAQGGGNGETHFFVEIISDKFEGLTQIKRHRLVNKVLEDEFERGLHALSLRTRTRKEADKIAPDGEEGSPWTAPQSSSPPEARNTRYFRRVTREEPAQWQRIANLLGGIGGTFTCGYLVLYADYGEKEHCFTPVRKLVFDQIV